MEQSLKISRLEATIRKLKELDPNKFIYSNYVDEYDPVKKCGTRCCVLGWHPLWFPESGFIWVGDPSLSKFRTTIGIAGEELESTSSMKHYEAILMRLQEWYGLGKEAIRYLFYGRDEYWSIELEG